MNLLSSICSALDWPDPSDILAPQGDGAAVQARLAKDKIEATLARMADASGVRVGLLLQDHRAKETTSPFAIVCEFPRTMSDETIAEAHRLAWNFCRAPMLITIEPGNMRVWSCMRQPMIKNGRVVADQAELKHLGSTGIAVVSAVAKRALSWIELVTGQFFRENDEYFPNKGRADRQLLAAMKAVRKDLKEAQLNDDVAHDLLARLIFIQFLWDRKDSNGDAALTPAKLKTLYDSGELSKKYGNIAEILRNYEDAYKLFHYLNSRFNGDLFPGKADTAEAREEEWQQERSQVKQKHLKILADFITGEIQHTTGQYSLWRLYAFDTIPLEFISSVYEEFVHKKGEATGAHYTPLHLVDFVLDGVLPWNEAQWNLRVIDPACGSGIFLVKAFQRLVHRWRLAHPAESVTAPVLTGLLENNLVGVDSDPHATRVASFSLYLALCDELDPRSYWTDIKFPILRERTIIHSDFFKEGNALSDTVEAAGSYDLVVGNAPWGKNSAKGPAIEWARTHKHLLSDADVGPLFLRKAFHILKEGGHVSMVQPALTILLGRWPKALKFRQALFNDRKVTEVVNFSAHRKELFPNASSAACCITITNTPADGQPIRYICTKLLHTAEDKYRISIDPLDVSWVQPQEGAQDPHVWSALMLGGHRELGLVRKLKTTFESIAERKVKSLSGLRSKRGAVLAQEGIQVSPGGSERPALRSRRFLSTPDLNETGFLSLDATSVPVATTLKTRRNTDPEVFGSPQLLFKQSFTEDRGRFHAVCINPEDGLGVVCSESYISVRANEDGQDVLDAISLSANSLVGLFFLAATSSRMGFVPEVQPGEFYALPVPNPVPGLLAGVADLGELDELAMERFNLNSVERILVEDVVLYSIPEVLRKRNSLGRQPTPADGSMQDAFAHTAMRVFHAAFGKKLPVCATVFHEQGTERTLSMRIIALHLNCSLDQHLKVHTEFLPPTDLSRQLRNVGRKGTSATIYDAYDSDGHTYPTIFILKPDLQRYWARSVALRDADQLVAAGLAAPGANNVDRKVPSSVYG